MAPPPLFLYKMPYGWSFLALVHKKNLLFSKPAQYRQKKQRVISPPFNPPSKTGDVLTLHNSLFTR